MIKSFIFDADGTLLDSMGFWTSVVYDLAAASGKQPEDGLIETLTPMSMVEGARYMKARYGLKMPIEQLMEEENKRVLEFYSERVELIDGMKELVELLSRRGFPMVVATATDSRLIDIALRHTGIREHFAAVLSCSDTGIGKDRPDIFLRACELMGTKPDETLVTDDSPIALECAQKAGFPVVYGGILRFDRLSDTGV